MKRFRPKWRMLVMWLVAGQVAGIAGAPQLWANDCQSSPPPADFARSDVYAKLPFKAGEVAEYSVDYNGVHVGYGNLQVEKPIKLDIVTGVVGGKPQYKSYWHMYFKGDAYTGDWYSAIFRGHDVIAAYARPWNFAVSRFYIRQNEKAAFQDAVKQIKRLEFMQQLCLVTEQTTNEIKNQTKTKNINFQYGAADVLGAIYKLRTLTYKKGQSQRYLVYSSEKDWWIEATSEGVETVTVKAGKFVADKLKLKTFIGKQMQAKSDSHVWIARDHPSRPMVKVEAEVKIGSVDLELEKFQPGH